MGCLDVAKGVFSYLGAQAVPHGAHRSNHHLAIHKEGCGVFLTFVGQLARWFGVVVGSVLSLGQAVFGQDASWVVEPKGKPRPNEQSTVARVCRYRAFRAMLCSTHPVGAGGFRHRGCLTRPVPGHLVVLGLDFQHKQWPNMEIVTAAVVWSVSHV